MSLYMYLLYTWYKSFSKLIRVKWIKHGLNTNLQLNHVLMLQFSFLPAGYQSAYCSAISLLSYPKFLLLLSEKWYLIDLVCIYLSSVSLDICKFALDVFQKYSIESALIKKSEKENLGRKRLPNVPLFTDKYYLHFLFQYISSLSHFFLNIVFCSYDCIS